MSTAHKYLDFELRIDELGGERYRATVVDMPLGEDQAQVINDFVLPFAGDELNRTLAVLSGRLRVSGTERARVARTFGEGLFKAVFAGPVYTVYFSSRDRARMVEGLRIKLALEQAGSLRDLPWEFLRDPAVDYLALSRTTPLVRYPRRMVIRPRPAFKPPLRVLVMVSSPSDMEPIDVQAEWRNLQAATASLRAQGKLELDLLDDASLRTLQRVLRAGDYHVFHYIGHSAFDATTEQGMLALEDPFGEGSSFAVRGEDLARELSEENTIRLVVMNSCQSAVTQETDPFAGIASSLVARGLPAVVAMQYAISDRAARVFSEELYRSVADGLPVDAAVAEARRAISHTAGGIEWATPVLFMRAGDGYLFDFGTERAGQPLWRRLPAPVLAAGIMITLIALLVLAAVLGFLPDGDGPDQSPTADLSIEQIEIFPPRPIPGEKAAIIVHIVNNGDKTIGPFDYDFREDVLSDSPDFVGTVSSLAPGDSLAVFIPHAFTWWGAFVSEVRVDARSDIPEIDEFNNIRRNPIVTTNEAFVITFDELPDGAPVTESMPLPDDAFAAWGFELAAVPAEDSDCAGAVPWIIVEGSTRYLGTGLPTAPDQCSDAGLAINLVRGTIGGLVAVVDVDQARTYSLTAFDPGGDAVEEAVENLTAGEGELSVSGEFPNRLDMARGELQGATGTPLRVTRLELAQPSLVGRVLR
ncbi:MAG: CHAT domain-containing protein [Anaerolineae bacterium]|nr:CHAT domain-containing protein [Anaerolineae bacterium]